MREGGWKKLEQEKQYWAITVTHPCHNGGLFVRIGCTRSIIQATGVW